MDDFYKGKSQAIPLQTWRDPEFSRNLLFTDFMTTKDFCRMPTLSAVSLYPQEMLLVLISIKG
jgi:hypothetical protein